ncbi:MAG: hypothetical protein Faunusvirus35_4 [Faunusvirus sp.]|jgi:hypothetical protein|uniref:Uncharacterized protein n=1 Tax=Faunusvirus sp. TaxID=2487766 RepID=A0A3G4ZXM8_9VIRU|nr:MAG: hypothetical protein Faunusvirus35_4 [Faunusvirus sp.]
MASQLQLASSFGKVTGAFENVTSDMKHLTTNLTKTKNKVAQLGNGLIEIAESIDDIIKITEKVSDGINTVKTLTIEYNELVLDKISKQDIQLNKLNTVNKVLLFDKMQRDFVQGLSDIYREYNNSIEEMLEERVEQMPIYLRLDLNSIISAYNEYSKNVNSKKNYVQELKEIILPNIQQWYSDSNYGKWDWDFFVWFHRLNGQRNGFSHLFYGKEDPQYKQKLTELSGNFDNEELVQSIHKLNDYKSYLIEFIKDETS